MTGQQQGRCLLPGIRAALLCALLTGLLALLTLRNAFLRSPHHLGWELLAHNSILPHWSVLALNVWLYIWLVWLLVAFFRIAQGTERIIVLGLSANILLS